MTNPRPNEDRAYWRNPTMRAHVTAAALALLVREMKDVGTPDVPAFKALHDLPDRIDAAMTRGPDALVFYSVDAVSARGMVSADEQKLDAFARVAHAAGSRVLCFNPTIIASLASMVEPNIGALVDATSPVVKYDA